MCRERGVWLVLDEVMTGFRLAKGGAQEHFMSIRAFLYDATGTDREVTLDSALISDLHDRQMLWVDVLASGEEEVRRVGATLMLTRESIYTLLHPGHRPRLDNYGDYFHLNVDTIEESEGKYNVIELNFILARNVMLTVHSQPVAFLESFDRRIKGDSDLGQLDTISFLAALLDWHITSYFRIIDLLEAQIDRIDARALRPRHTRDLLSDLARLRQRVAFIRRHLTPHREVYAAMARPDFHTDHVAHQRSHQDADPGFLCLAAGRRDRGHRRSAVQEPGLSCRQRRFLANAGPDRLDRFRYAGRCTLAEVDMRKSMKYEG